MTFEYHFSSGADDQGKKRQCRGSKNVVDANCRRMVPLPKSQNGAGAERGKSSESFVKQEPLTGYGFTHYQFGNLSAKIVIEDRHGQPSRKIIEELASRKQLFTQLMKEGSQQSYYTNLPCKFGIVEVEKYWREFGKLLTTKGK